MKRFAPALLIVLAVAGWPGSPFGRELTLAAINAADLADSAAKTALIFKAQVLLDRAGFSPGVIDGRGGANFKNALNAFQRENGLNESGHLDPATWSKLVETSPEPATREYVVTAEDVRGPFVAEIPDSFEQQARLKRLAYTGPAELLAEKFHMDEDLLAELNPGRAMDQAGTIIVVANVRQTPPKIQVSRLVVDKAQRSVRAFDRDGKLVGVFPASLGSDDKPTPTGTLKITRVLSHPVYYYNPRFRFPGVTASRRLRIAAGPNNPVGTVWMNLNERSYGIHGSAEPFKIGRTYSHGCVRLTNWDARKLAAMVKKGTTVEFVD